MGISQCVVNRRRKSGALLCDHDTRPVFLLWIEGLQLPDDSQRTGMGFPLGLAPNPPF